MKLDFLYLVGGICLVWVASMLLGLIIEVMVTSIQAQWEQLETVVHTEQSNQVVVIAPPSDPYFLSVVGQFLGLFFRHIFFLPPRTEKWAELPAFVSKWERGQLSPSAIITEVSECLGCEVSKEEFTCTCGKSKVVAVIDVQTNTELRTPVKFIEQQPYCEKCGGTCLFDIATSGVNTDDCRGLCTMPNNTCCCHLA